MELLGYSAALLIGLSLGLIGGGGSILTVPILVYLFGIDPVLATSYSLFIVGVSSFVGSIGNLLHRYIDWRTVVIFGLLSVITVFCVRHFIIPQLPQQVTVTGYRVSMSFITMMLFAGLMVLSSFSMMRGEEREQSALTRTAGRGEIAFYGIVVGLITGLLGAGGGFLLIPALTLLLRIPVRTAIGTSLLIITINSLVGFADDVTHHVMDWRLLIQLTGISVIGILAGLAIGQRVNGTVLKRGFGWFVLLMGLYIIIHELTRISIKAI